MAGALGVVVLNWNGREDTLRALGSLFASSYQFPFRVYVPDNGSQDGSVDAIHAQFPEAIVVENGANLGYAGGNNRGWQKAADDGCDTILFFNNDAVIAPDALDLLRAALHSAPDIGAVSARIVQESDGAVWFEKGRITLDRFVIAAHVPATERERAQAVYDSDLACGCALLARTETLKKVGGFDESLFAYYEDVDLSLKIRALDLRCVVAPRAQVTHRVSASTGGAFSPTAAFYVFRNGRRLARRHAPTPEDWRRYQRTFLREWLSQVKWLTREGAASFGASSGGAALLGGLCALAGQTGPRPSVPEAPFRFAAACLAGAGRRRA